MRIQFLLAAAILSAGSAPHSTSHSASGSLGVYAIVQRVQFEPNEQAPERIRVYGAFVFVNGGINRAMGVTEARRGFLYFSLPAPATPNANLTATRREWNDIKAVAGMGQAIAFGDWFYLGQFASFIPNAAGTPAPRVLTSQPNTVGELRVYADSAGGATPALYMTNVGVVKLTEPAHANVIARLRTALR